MHKPNRHKGQPANRRDWRKIHHSPLFWVGVVLFVMAVALFLI